MKRFAIVAICLLVMAGTIMWLGAPAGAAPAFDCSTVTDISQAECEALVALYNATDGENWTNNENWLQTDTPCGLYGGRWHGVVSCVEVTDEVATIRWLDLRDNNLVGAIPPEIDGLIELERLLLPGNKISSVPAEIGNLTRLRQLRLADNRLTGLPPEVGQMSDLGLLQLSGNRLTSLPAEIGDLTGPVYLYVDDNYLSTVPSEIGQLTNLVDLGLHNNRLSSLPSTFDGLTNLNYLNLAGNQLNTIPPAIESMTALEDLFLQDNPLSGPLPTSLTQLTALRQFWFYDTALCTPPDDAALGAWLETIPYLGETGYVCGEPAGALSGQVTGEGQPLPGVAVRLYRSVSWYGPTPTVTRLVDTTTADAAGNYSFAELGQDVTYQVFVADPAGEYAPEYYDDAVTVANATPLTATLGLTRTGVNIALEMRAAPLATITTPGGSVQADPNDGTVVVNMVEGQPADVTVTDVVTCSGGSTPDAVDLVMVPHGPPKSYPMSAVGGDSYQATVPAADITLETSLVVRATCDGDTTSPTVGAIRFYQPLGMVGDALSGLPLANATVTLFRVPGWQPANGPDDPRANTCETAFSRDAGAPWSQPAPAGEGIVVNPDLVAVSPALSRAQTDNQGRYGWELAEAPNECWYVTVSAEGYVSQTSPVVGVPPAVTDLDLMLIPEATHSSYLPALLHP